MASLKEVKTRIGSVSNTKKITLARQMVSSAEFHRSQSELEHARIYNRTVELLTAKLLAVDPGYVSPLLQQREKGAMALIVMASNSGMAGAFNSRMIKELEDPKKNYPGEELILYPLGKKIREEWTRRNYDIAGNFDYLMDKPSPEQIAEFVNELTRKFLKGEIKRVDVASYRFKSMGTQNIVRSTLLPFTPTKIVNKNGEVETTDFEKYYLLEPSANEIIDDLLPLCLKSDFHEILTENRTSEHAARMLAMQVASENADELLEELKLTYNKVRQQNITAELLDLMGSTFA